MTDDFERTPASDEALGNDATAPEVALTDIARARRRSSGRGMIAVIAVLVLAVLLFGGVRANAIWGRHAMVVTGATAAQALVEGEAARLAAVSGPDVRAKLTTATVVAMKANGVLGEFSAPAWSGDEATITVTTGTGIGEIVVAPAADGADVVIFRTGRAIGMASGALGMKRTWTGWIVAEVAVAPIQKPASHPSATPTPTPAP